MTAPTSSPLPAVGDADHVTGSQSPELILVEYGDFGCPYCSAARRPVQSLLDRFEGLSLVWRHLPDAELHPGADLAAELSELAAVSGMFWDAHSQLLVGRARFTHEELISTARRLGLDTERAEATLRERRFRQHVIADIEGGTRAGAHATPTFFVDGERLEGSWHRLAEIVPARLAAA